MYATKNLSLNSITSLKIRNKDRTSFQKFTREPESLASVAIKLLSFDYRAAYTNYSVWSLLKNFIGENNHDT